MKQKNYTDVLIDGRIYTLGGTEDELYLQQVAAYINEKTGKLRKQEGFLKQSAEYQSVMLQLNIADDYFKEQERADGLAQQKAALEKGAYSLKHEMITTQMKLENMEKELEEIKERFTAQAASTEQLALAAPTVQAASTGQAAPTVQAAPAARTAPGSRGNGKKV